MTAHVWFLVVALTGHPGEQPLQFGRLSSRAACMASAPARLAGLQNIGVHGRYLCMYHNQPDTGLARDPIGVF
jgi:hypothetical protein